MPEHPPRAEGPGLAESIKDPVGAFLNRQKAEAPKEAAVASEIFRGLTPDHKAELLWEMYQELRAEKKVPPEQASLLAALHADAETKAAYEQGLKRHEEERKIVNGSYEEYRLLQRRIDRLEYDYDLATRKLFAKRGERASAFDKLAYQKITEHLADARRELAKTLEAHPKLAGRVSYDRMAHMNHELTEDKFIWMPSRRAILERLEEAALLGRPVLMMGESGTGKTSLVEAAAKRLTGQLPFKAQGGPSTRLQDSLAWKAIKGDTSYLEFGPLGQAITGKESSLEEEPRSKGGIYFDDEFNNRSRAVQMEIVKAVSGIRPGHEARLPLIGKTDVQNEYLFVAAGNPAGERYEREATDPAVRREFGSAIDVDYPELSPENPEWFEAMLAALMDRNGRLRFAKSELEPAFDRTKEKVVPGGRKERVLSQDPLAGGALWRFAQATSELWKSFSRKETVLSHLGEGQYLAEFVLDPGVILGWLRQAVEEGYRDSLERYLVGKLENKLAEAGIAKEDRDLARKFFTHYGLGRAAPEKPAAFAIMTPEEVGLLSPRVKYLKAEAPTEFGATAIVMGKPVQYRKAPPKEALSRREPATGDVATLLGTTKAGELVVETPATAARKEARIVAKPLFDSWPLVEPEPKGKRRRPREMAPELEAVREIERRRLKEFFGKDMDVPLLPEGITPERIKEWRELGFELRYLPPMTLQESDNYPGWKKKPDQGLNLFSNLQNIQQLTENQANANLKGLAPNQLPGSWALKDTRKKPNYREGKQTYTNDAVIHAVLQKLAQKTPPALNPEAAHGRRSHIHPKIFDDPRFWEEFKKALKLEDIEGVTVRLPRAIEANVMGQSPDFDGTSTYEWCEEYFQSGGRLLSGGSSLGGASFVFWDVGPGDLIGFRPLVVFSPELGNLEPGALDLWEKKLRELPEQESHKLSAFFEKRIDVPPLPAEITPERLANWEKLGLELHYFPAEDMPKDRQLTAWKKKPNDWFYDRIAAGEIPKTATQLPEGWFVVDGRQKPNYANGSQMYDNDPLAPAMEELNRRGLIAQTKSDERTKLDPKTRFGLSPADFDKPEVVAALAEALDLDADQLSLPQTMVWNILANIHHSEWGTTSTSEWLKEMYGSGSRLISGFSAGGGASGVDWHDRPYDGLGFRPLGRFSP